MRRYKKRWETKKHKHLQNIEGCGKECSDALEKLCRGDNCENKTEKRQEIQETTQRNGKLSKMEEV
jgi:uncharacterized protein Yka (UPF0111/DUF47 family)